MGSFLNKYSIKKIPTYLALLISIVELADAKPLKDARCETRDPKTPELYAMLGDVGYSWQDNCYFRVAEQTNEIRYCESISDRVLHSACNRLVAAERKDYKLCFEDRKLGSDYIAKEYERDCLSSYARTNDDPEVCKVYRKGKIDSGCIREYEVNKAAKKK
jgi:hypothetical protein